MSEPVSARDMVTQSYFQGTTNYNRTNFLFQQIRHKFHRKRLKTSVLWNSFQQNWHAVSEKLILRVGEYLRIFMFQSPVQSSRRADCFGWSEVQSVPSIKIKPDESAAWPSFGEILLFSSWMDFRLPFVLPFATKFNCPNAAFPLFCVTPVNKNLVVVETGMCHKDGRTGVFCVCSVLTTVTIYFGVFLQRNLSFEIQGLNCKCLRERLEILPPFHSHLIHILFQFLLWDKPRESERNQFRIVELPFQETGGVPAELSTLTFRLRLLPINERPGN